MTSTYELKTKTIKTNKLVIVNIPSYYSISQMKKIHDALRETMDNFIVLPEDVNIENTSIEQLEYMVDKLQTFIVTKKILDSNE